MRWTDDGTAIIFRADDWTRVRIYRVSVVDGSLTELPPVESGGHMSLSPSRTLIMDVRGHRTIRVFPTDGGSPYNVYEFTDPDLRVDYPVWSPDGRWVLFDRAEPRGGDLWTISDE
jgi:Tol biopolymer transport system component